MSDLPESRSNVDAWRVLIVVGAVLLLVGGAALVVGLFVDTLMWIWVSIPVMTLALPILVVGVVGFLITRSRVE